MDDDPVVAANEVPEPWTAEDEDSLPDELQDWFRWFEQKNARAGAARRRPDDALPPKPPPSPFVRPTPPVGEV
jgi:hypothetical protein